MKLIANDTFLVINKKAISGNWFLSLFDKSGIFRSILLFLYSIIRQYNGIKNSSLTNAIVKNSKFMNFFIRYYDKSFSK